jgi:hypothetical protein
MARLHIDLDEQTYERLVAASVAERRPIAWQAEIILRYALADELTAVQDDRGTPTTTAPDLPEGAERGVG